MDIAELLSRIPQDRKDILDARLRLAVRLDDAMRSRDLDVRDLSASIGFSPSLVRAMLSGSHDFTPSELSALSRFFCEPFGY